MNRTARVVACAMIIGLGVGVTLPAQAAPKKASKATITITRVANPTILGGKIKFSGSIAEKRAGKPIRIQVYNNNGWYAKWQTIGTLKTAANGKYSGTLKATVYGTSVKYRAVFPGDTTFKSSTSTARVITNVYKWFDASKYSYQAGLGAGHGSVIVGGQRSTKSLGATSYDFRPTSSISIGLNRCLTFRGTLGADTFLGSNGAGVIATVSVNNVPVKNQHYVIGVDNAVTALKLNVSGKSSLKLAATWDGVEPENYGSTYGSVAIANPQVLCAKQPSGYWGD